jgi:hypothetical protein
MGCVWKNYMTKRDKFDQPKKIWGYRVLTHGHILNQNFGNPVQTSHNPLETAELSLPQAIFLRCKAATWWKIDRNTAIGKTIKIIYGVKITKITWSFPVLKPSQFSKAHKPHRTWAVFTTIKKHVPLDPRVVEALGKGLDPHSCDGIKPHSTTTSN